MRIFTTAAALIILSAPAFAATNTDVHNPARHNAPAGHTDAHNPAQDNATAGYINLHGHEGGNR